MENALRRGVRDFWRDCGGAGYQWSSVVIAAIAGLLVAFNQPDGASTKAQGIYGVAGALGAAFALGLVMLTWNLLRAPYRQRDEVLKQLAKVEEQNGPQGLIPAIDRPEFHWQSDHGHLIHDMRERPTPNGHAWLRGLSLWVVLKVPGQPVYVETLNLLVQGQRIPPAGEWEARRLIQEDSYTYAFLIPDDIVAGWHEVSIVVGGNGKEWEAEPIKAEFPLVSAS